MISAETMAELEARRLLYILGVRERSDKLVRELVLDDPAPFVQSSTIAIQYRFAEGRFARLPELAAELVRLNVDVIVAVVTQASLAAKDATNSIPIVMVAVSDPVSSGLVASLRHPGANVTGTSGMTGEVVGKSLELLREAVPGISRVAVLWNPDNSVFQTQLLRGAQAAAAVLGVQLKTFGMQGPDELDLAFSAITAERADALLVLADPGLALHQQRIVAFAEQKPPSRYVRH